jgi:hypothetical protein
MQAERTKVGEDRAGEHRAGELGKENMGRKRKSGKIQGLSTAP